MAVVRKCKKCGAAFSPPRCKVCRKAQLKTYYDNNREKILARSAKWDSEHPDKARDRVRKYSKNNKEKELQRAARYRRENRGAVLESQRIAAHNRRAIIRGSEGKLSKGLSAKLLVLQKNKCVCCRRSLEYGYHQDHIVPLAMKGPNEDGNIQLLCPTCNLSKKAKHPVEFMQSRGFLL